MTFNLAETTRMIEVARALGDRHTSRFMGYEDDYVHLIRDAGFDYTPCQPAWGRAERAQAIAFDQGKALRSPFTADLVAQRVAVERRFISAHSAAVVVIGSNITSLISARAEGVPLLFPVPFGLTGPQVAQTRHLGLVGGGDRFSRMLDRGASAAFRWIYNRAPLAPRAFTSVAKVNGVAPLRSLASLFEADLNLLTVMPWELSGYVLPAGYRRVGPIFAHLDVPWPDVVGDLAPTGVTAVRRVLSDESVARAAERVKSEFAEEDGAAAVAAIIDEALAGGQVG